MHIITLLEIITMDYEEYLTESNTYQRFECYIVTLSGKWSSQKTSFSGRVGIGVACEGDKKGALQNFHFATAPFSYYRFVVYG